MTKFSELSKVGSPFIGDEFPALRAGANVTVKEDREFFDLTQIDTFMDYNFTDVSKMTLVGSAISGMADNSAYAVPLVTQGSGQRPTYVAAAGGAEAYAQFNGGQALYADVPCLATKQDLALFIIQDVGPNNSQALYTEYSANQWMSYVLTDTSGRLSPNGFGQFGLPVSQTAVFDSTKRLLRLEEGDGLMTAYSNGSPLHGAFKVLKNQDLLRTRVIGARNPAGNSFALSGKIYRIVACPSKYADQVEGYLAWTHGLTSLLPSTHPYKNRPPRRDDTTVFAGFDKYKPIRHAAIGDSWQAYAYAEDTTKQCHFSNGLLAWLIRRSKGRIYTPIGNLKATAGEQVGSMVSRVRTDFDSKTFDLFVINGGINNLTGNDVRGTCENIGNLINYGANVRGAVVLVHTLGSFPTATSDAASCRKIRQINAWLRKQAGRFRGRVFIADTWATSVDPTTDAYVANCSYDGLHPNDFGGYLWGNAGWSAIGSMIPDVDFNFHEQNVLANGANLSGTAGTAGTLAVGATVADSFTLYGSGGATNRTGSKEANNAQIIGMSQTGGTATDTLVLEQAVAQGTKFAIGDTLYGVVEVDITGIPQNIKGHTLELVLSGTGVQTFTTVQMGDTLSYETPDAQVDTGRITLVTPDLTITAGTSLTVTWRYKVTGDSSSAKTTSFSAKVYNAGIFKR